MRGRLNQSVLIFMCLGIAATASAQFGHPLKGSWSGDWGPDKTNRTHLLLEIGWDGKGAKELQAAGVL